MTQVNGNEIKTRNVIEAPRHRLGRNQDHASKPARVAFNQVELATCSKRVESPTPVSGPTSRRARASLSRKEFQSSSQTKSRHLRDTETV